MRRPRLITSGGRAPCIRAPDSRFDSRFESFSVWLRDLDAGGAHRTLRIPRIDAAGRPVTTDANPTRSRSRIDRPMHPVRHSLTAMPEPAHVPGNRPVVASHFDSRLHVHGGTMPPSAERTFLQHPIGEARLTGRQRAAGLLARSSPWCCVKCKRKMPSLTPPAFGGGIAGRPGPQGQPPGSYLRYASNGLTQQASNSRNLIQARITPRHLEAAQPMRAGLS